MTWAAVGLLLSIAVGVDAYFIRASTDIWDHDKKNVFVFSVTAGTLLLIGFWLLLRSSLSARTKRIVFSCGAVLLTILAGTLRFEGFTGDMWPKLTFRWTPKADTLLPDLAPSELADSQTGGVDLTQPAETDFPQFLGPQRNSSVSGIHLARDWQASPPKQIWKRKIGGGLSGFSVVGQFAVTQEQRGEEKLLVCYKLLTGEPVWSYAMPGRFVSLMGKDGPRATPTIDDGKIYCQWSEGLLTCHAGNKGELLWSHDLLAEHKAENIYWGRSGSPLIAGELVIVSAGGPEGHSLVAYDKQTGQLVWHAGDDRPSYASPTLANLAGEEQVLTVNEDWVASHSLTDGKILWRTSWPGKSDSNPNSSQPVPLPDDHLFLSHGYSGGCQLLKITKDESQQWHVQVVHEDKSLMKTKMSNVVVRGDYVYGLSGGILECVEWRTLARQWKRGRYGHGQLLLVGDLLLVTVEETGEIALVPAEPDRPEQLGVFQAVTGQTWNSLALAGTYLLVRNETEAGCYQLPTAR